MIKSTIVFQKTLEAINAVDEKGERKYKYIVHEGSSRSSKTQSIIQLVHKECSTNPNLRVSVWRDTKTDCVATVGYDVKRVFKGLPNYSFIKENKTKHHFDFWTNSIFELNGSDDEDKVIGYQGDITWINEPYKISKETFDQLDMRTSDYVLIDWNPKKAHWIEDLKKDPRTITIHSTFLDNPFCPEEQKKKILGYQPVSMSNVVLDKILSEQEAKSYNIVENEKGIEQKYLDQLSRCILNEAKNSASLFNWKVYGLGLKAEKPNRIYSHFNKITLDEFKALNSTTYYGVDWGQVDPFAILEAKYYDGTLYLNELNYASENDIKGQLSTQLLEQIRNEDEGLVKYLFTRLDLNKSNYVICDNNRPQKVMSLRQLGYDYAITSPKGKGSIKDGIDLLQTINVCYTEKSTNFEYETENYQWKTDRYNLIVDEPLDLDNHLMDVLRYIALFLKNQRIIKNI